MFTRTTDVWNIARAMTGPRLMNAARIWSSYQRARWTGSAEISGMPIAMSVEPTTSCNLRCPECPSGLRSFTRPTGMLDERLFGKLLDEVGPTLAYLIFYFQGEPFLHPRFLELVREATRRGIYTATSTNAHFIGEEIARQIVSSGLQRLIISLDGVTQEVYEQYRVGGKLDKVLEGTRNILAARKAMKAATPHVIFQFLAVGPNEHQIADVHHLAAQMGVDQVAIKTAQIYDFENGSPLIPQQDKYARYRRNSEGRYEIKNTLDNRCWKMWHSSVMTWDGRIVPCCFDKDAQHVMGILREQSFKSIWNGEAYRHFRSTLLHSRKEIEICRNCTEGTRVWA